MKKFVFLSVAVLLTLSVFTGCKPKNEAKDANNVQQEVNEKSNEKLNQETEKKETQKDGNSAKTQAVSVEEISQEQAKEFMDKEEYEVIIDIRSFEEYNKEHIENAICLPAEGIREETLTMLIPSKEQSLLIYGDSEEESREIAEKISAMGYKTVKSFGTMKNWKYETEKEDRS